MVTLGLNQVVFDCNMIGESEMDINITKKILGDILARN